MKAEKSFSLHPARGMQRSVRIALLVLSAVGVLAIVAGMEAFNVTERAIDYENALERSIERRAQIRRISSMFQEAETSQRGFLLTNDVKYLERFESTREELHEPLNGLLGALSDSSEQVARAIRLNELARTRMRQLSDVLAEVPQAEHAPGPSGAIIHSSRADAAMRTRSQIQEVLENMIAVEEQNIRDASGALNERLRFSRILMIVLLALIVLLVTFVVALGLAYLAHRGRVETELHEAMTGAQQASEAKTQFLDEPRDPDTTDRHPLPG